MPVTINVVFGTDRGWRFSARPFAVDAGWVSVVVTPGDLIASAVVEMRANHAALSRAAAMVQDQAADRFAEMQLRLGFEG